MTAKRKSAVLGLVLALIAGASAAHGAGSVRLEDFTWTELKAAIDSGTTTIIVPIGGTEQSGPAMALGKHNGRVEILAAKIAEALGHTLVAPVVAYVPEGNIDPPTGHMAFPGTITIGDATFKALLESAAASFRHAGFTTIVLIGDHGGYQADLTAVADTLNKKWQKSPARVFADRNYYDITEQGYVQALLAAGVKQGELGTHAGLADTSLTLALAPDLVRADELAKGSSFTAKDGVYGGDPTRSTAALGQLGVDLIVAGTVEDIQHFIAQQATHK